MVGVDRRAEAMEFARAQLPRCPICASNRPRARRCRIADGAFDLVVAFEVIEHLENWREFLREVRRVLAPAGQFIVSTPNKLYYTESRGAHGANPFHVHEFDFEEFRDELQAVFPHVSLFLENHVEGVTFQPHERGHTVEVRVDAGEPAPDESHFFVAVCAHRPQMGNPTFRLRAARRQRAARARAAHRAARRRTGHQERMAGEGAAGPGGVRPRAPEAAGMFREQKAELEQSNHWAEELNRGAGGARARASSELQEELAREQENARAVVAAYDAKVAELEQDVRAKTQWARDVEARLTRDAKIADELARPCEALHQTEKELEERTAWALRLEEEAAPTGRAARRWYAASRWVKLGRKVGLGPDPRALTWPC